MGMIIGRDSFVTVSGTIIVAAMAKWSISDSRNSLTTETYDGDVVMVRGHGPRSINGSVSGYYDPADVTGQTILYNNYIARTEVPGFRLYATGNSYWYNTGGVFIENHNIGSEVAGVVSVDFTWQASGDWILTTGVSPVQGDTLAAAIIHASTDNKVARYSGTNDIQGSSVSIDDSGNVTANEFHGDGINLTNIDKYTQSEVDDLITTISGKLDDHDELNNLDYASAGHTGFQPAGDYLTNTEFSTYSGTLQSQIDDKSDTSHNHNLNDLTEKSYNSLTDTPTIPTDFYSTSEVDTISGSLQTNIDGKSDTSHNHTASDVSDFSEATDDRVSNLLIAGDNISLDYNDVANTLTISGSAGGGGVENHSALNELDYASAGHSGFASEDALTTTSGSLSTEIDSDISTHTALSDAHHAESHTVASHSDTTATGAELETLNVIDKIWTYQDTAPAGWSIITGTTDALLACKGGTGTYNTTGGTQVGTWTQPSHTLISSEIPDHTHDVNTTGAHTHTLTTYSNLQSGGVGWGDFDAGSTYKTTSSDGDHTHTVGGGGGDGGHNHGTTYRPLANVGIIIERD